MGCVGPPELKLIREHQASRVARAARVRWKEGSGNMLASAIVVAYAVGWDSGLCLDSLCLRVFYGDLERRQCVYMCEL